MAYIAPNSTIKILRGVPLESDYVNTLYFATASAQTTYFSGKAKYTLNNQSYQRSNKGVCRVNYKVEDLYDCNYLMFQNTSFGTKWFYAFITSVDYINNVTADIHYEIDVMQTWLKDMSLRMCFVEREHSATDDIGDNIVAEPIEVGEYVFNSYQKLIDDDMAIVVLTVDVDNPTGTLIDGVYSGAHVKAFSTSSAVGAGIENLNAYLATFNVKPEAIIGMYMCPAKAIDVGQQTLDDGVDLVYQAVCEHDEISDTPLTDTMTIDGHIVRNNKLFTYPYNFYHVGNANGKDLLIRYEFCQDDHGVKNYTPQFKLFFNIAMPVSVIMRPMNYKNVVDDFIKTESLELTNYPMCSWNTDSWKTWVAQEALPLAVNSYQQAYSGIVSGVQNLIGIRQSMGGKDTIYKEAQMAAGGAATSVEVVSSILTQVYRASIKADVCRGSINSGNINVASEMQNFFGGRMSVCNQMAKIIDDFFDKYGYATNEVKVPNIHNRPAWNYVKTIGSNVDGNIPADDKRIIDANFDKGITFWHNPAKVDDYSQNNAPVSP